MGASGLPQSLNLQPFAYETIPLNTEAPRSVESKDVGLTAKPLNATSRIIPILFWNDPTETGACPTCVCSAQASILLLQHIQLDNLRFMIYSLYKQTQVWTAAQQTLLKHLPLSLPLLSSLLA